MWSAAWCSGSASATITSSSSAFCTSSRKPYSLAAVHMGRWEVKMDLRCQHSNILKSPNQISVIFTHPLRSLSQMYNVFPWLMEWLPGRHHKMFDKFEKVRQFTMEKIKEHQDTLDPSSPRDYIDCFLMRLHQVRRRLQPELGNQIISFFAPPASEFLCFHSFRKSIYQPQSSFMTTWCRQCWICIWQELKPPAQPSDTRWMCWSNTQKSRVGPQLNIRPWRLIIHQLFHQ